jgi:hypothetical protein
LHLGSTEYEAVEIGSDIDDSAKQFNLIPLSYLIVVLVRQGRSVRSLFDLY